MKEREALKLALDLLRKKEWEACDYVANANEAADILEKALAQPEQEPVAWYDTEEYGSIRWANEWSLDEGAPLYTTPPQRKPLTDEEIVDIVGNCAADSGGWFRYHALARAIEAAHGIKE